MSEINRKLIGNRIKERREISNLTLEQVGAGVGKTFATIAKYESGEIKNIDIMVIAKIAEMTNTNIEYLLLKTNLPEEREEIKNLPFISNINGNINYSTFCYRAVNDEMALLLDVGDVAIIQKQEKIENGKTFLLQYENRTMIRKIIDNKNTITLQAMNPYYPIINTTKDKIKLIGKVIRAENSSAFK